jgi:hypothetical protein
MIYDCIIVGGGISGLYSAHLLLKQNPNAKILILEREGYLGGRVFTHHDKYMTVEAGAGRFSSQHTLLMEVIRELGLYKNLVKIPSDLYYSPSLSLRSDNGGNNVSNRLQKVDPTYINKVISLSKREPKQKLINMTFLEYASTILSKGEMEYIKDSFGYYSELVIMNAYDAIHLIRGLTGENQFFGLKGGLSHMIDELVRKISAYNGCRIVTKKTVNYIRIIDKLLSGTAGTAGTAGTSIIQVYCEENVRPYLGLNCICALPKQIIENIAFFKPWKPRFEEIVCAPLCRIYSKYLPGEDGEFWFSGLHKFTTDNDLRMVIPTGQEGVVMVSYTDNKFANKWQRLYKQKGEPGVDNEIHRLMTKSIGIHIPKPVVTNVFYWPCGVGYWGVGSDSSLFFRDMMQPNSHTNVFICGEHYSEKHQQWIEGALETAKQVVEKIRI